MSEKQKILITIVLVLLFLLGNLTIFPAINFSVTIIAIILAGILILATYVPITYNGRMIKTLLLCSVILSTFLLVFVKIKPATLNDSEKLYMQHFNLGYEYFRAKDYDKAINEYEAAQNLYNNDRELYIRKAWCYQRRKEYDKALVEAKNALQQNPKDSLYKKANGFQLTGSGEVSIYTTMGECYYKLKNYKEAKIAYSKVITQVTYKYSNVYFKRGLCNYYLQDYEAAKKDFLKHKEIVYSYLEDQNNSEYKAKHPVYTNKHLVNIEEWIKACEK